MSKIAIILIAFTTLFVGCTESNQDESRDTRASSDGSEWLRGDVDTRLELVARHLRGFDMAMVEVGYRYGELYWASRDRNWGYATYQLGKIETAIANGVQRRPKRAASAQMLDGAVTQVRTAIEARDASALDAAVRTLTATCNACHQAEQVPFMHVAPPDFRLSPIRLSSTPNPEEGRLQK
ncbi:MAG: cytochrome c [Verrucomicrobiae bacterium]|nr:cytochrome c [Verrucomicrobiae bacterium]